MEEVSFLQYALGFLALLTSLFVVLGKNPVVSAVALMGTLFTTAGLYFSLDAHFIGAVQILIYAGAISVLFVFIVMLLDLRSPNVTIPGRQWIYYSVGGVTVLFFLSSVILLKGQGSMKNPFSKTWAVMHEQAASAKAISLHLLSEHMLAFQLTGFLLLAAIVGVILIGKGAVMTRGRLK